MFANALRRATMVRWCLVAVVLISLWGNLAATRLWDRDETRNARCSVEMLERQDWIVPMFNDQLRTHKPILLYWLQMPAMAWLGTTEFAARCGSALMATLAVFGLYSFLEKQTNEQHAFWSAAALATSLMFVVAGRAATPDACLISTSTLGILGLANFFNANGERKAYRHGLVGCIFLGMAILAKGPVGLILPALVLGSWQFWENWHRSQDLKKAVLGFSGLFVRRELYLGVATVLLVSAPWYLWVGLRTNGEWLRGFFLEHNLGRATTAMEGHGGGWWFYPVASCLGLFPWSMLWIPIATWSFAQLKTSAREAKLIRLGIVWFFGYIFVFTLASTKLPSYISPGYPGAAILIGGFLSDWQALRIRLSRFMMLLGAAVFTLVGLGIFGGIEYLARSENWPQLSLQGVWSVGFTLTGLALVWLLMNRKPQAWIPNLMLGSALLFVTGLYGFLGPIVDSYRTDLNSIVAQTSKGNLDTDKAVWWSLRTIEPSWVYYLGLPIHERVELNLETVSHGQEMSQLVREVGLFLERSQNRLIIDRQQAQTLIESLQREGFFAVAPIVEFKQFPKGDSVVVLARSPEMTASLTDEESSPQR
jgi:4-amino-4-deoxy-L-arabinose transferase-like glycosyltransferase